MISFDQILAFGVLLLFIATLVGLVTRYLRLPYTVGLVIMGLCISLLAHLPVFSQQEAFLEIINSALSFITPDVILGLLVTPLIFEAAYHLNWNDLRKDLPLILLLAVPGVAVTTLLVGGIVYLGEGFAGASFPFIVALLFGAMMAATDPVSVVALFRYLGVPKRLQVLLEGESLFNDGTAIVVFTLVSSMALGESNLEAANGAVFWLEFLTDFIRVAGGGLIIGVSLGWLISKLISLFDDYLIETTLTIVLAFGAYILAEELHVSGVLAVVAAGLVIGNIGPKGMKPTTHIQVNSFWEFAAFMSNSVIFLLIGLEIDLTRMDDNLQLIFLAIIAVLLARFAVVYGLTTFRKDTPFRWRHVLFWGGLRGAISLVLALSLPSDVSWSTDLRNMAFAVVLFTILVQGFTMRPLIRRLRLVERSETQEEYERRHARAVSARAAYEHLEEMYQEGLFSDHTWEMLAPLLKEHADHLSNAVKEVLMVDPEVEAEEFDTARRELLRAQRSALLGLLTDGIISEGIYSELSQGIDIQLAKSQETWTRQIKQMVPHQEEINRLMTVIIQVQDVENAMAALNETACSVTRLTSSGGFLGRRNITLLVGLTEGQEEEVFTILKQSCRQRVEYISSPIEGAPFHLPVATPVEVGGATIFTLEVEHYEAI
jgi:CPA1 family monovalent cation:H+ antiporter